MSNTFTPQDARYWAERPVEEMVNDWGGKTYVESQDHPHRQLILLALKSFKPFKSVLEVGCNAAPNLIRIGEIYEAELVGVDISEGAIAMAKKELPGGTFKVGDAIDLPFEDYSYDIVIADAVYMYVKNAEKALDEAARVAKKGILICDWYSEKEEIKDFHYARDYGSMLEDRGFIVSTVDITENLWPSKKWNTNGKLFIAVRQ